MKKTSQTILLSTYNNIYKKNYVNGLSKTKACSTHTNTATCERTKLSRQSPKMKGKRAFTLYNSVQSSHHESKEHHI
jgi:hypothetical protein